MEIVDAQVHIWGADTPARPWPKRGEPQRPIPLGKDDLLREMDAAGVDRAIIVPPSWEGDRNDLATEAAIAHPFRFATMGRIDPQAPASRGQLADWREQSAMLVAVSGAILKKDSESLQGEDVREGLTAIVSVKVGVALLAR